MTTVALAAIALLALAVADARQKLRAPVDILGPAPGFVLDAATIALAVLTPLAFLRKFPRPVNTFVRTSDSNGKKSNSQVTSFPLNSLIWRHYKGRPTSARFAEDGVRPGSDLSPATPLSLVQLGGYREPESEPPLIIDWDIRNIDEALDTPWRTKVVLVTKDKKGLNPWSFARTAFNRDACPGWTARRFDDNPFRSW